jgi:sec-independent protein translocase protein TatC
VDDAALPLTAHLTELRDRILKILVVWIVAAAIAWTWKELIFGFLIEPAIQSLGEGATLQFISPTEPFFTYLKCALLAGFVFALPVIFWQIWSFIAPGLYPSEKKVAIPFVVASTLLFVSGGAFGYTFVFPLIFDFFASFESDFVTSGWTLAAVFALTTRLILAFGAGFEMPVVVFFLALAGIVEPRQLLGGLKYAVLISFVASAILTPPDIISQVMLAVPLTVLYLVGVGVAFVFAPKRESGTIAPETSEGGSE